MTGRSRTRLPALAALLALLALVTGPLSVAGAVTPRTSVVAVEQDVMCVSCGVPLSIAESTQADDERGVIKGLVDQGLTRKQVEDRLVGIYGPRVIAKPQHSGFGLTAYLVPVVIGLAIIAALAVMLPRWRAARRGAPDEPAVTAPALSTADASRLERDLARYDL